MKRDKKHGTVNEYATHKCRCVECRAANAEYARCTRARMKASILAGEVAVDDPRHGTRTFINYGCPCEVCRAFNRQYQAEALATRRANLGELVFKHGSNGYTNYGCRCEVCRTAWNEQCRVQYAKRKAARGD